MTGSAKKAAGTYTSCEFLLVDEWLTGGIFHPRVLPRCFAVALRVYWVYKPNNTMLASSEMGMYFRTSDYLHSVINQ